MQLYRTTANSKDAGKTPHVSWQGSMSDASKQRTTLKAEGVWGKPESVSVDVPTSKTALLDWLNAVGSP